MSEVPGWNEVREEAAASAAEGGVPIGAALVRDADGLVLARGRNRRVQDRGLAYHAEIVCLHAAGLVPIADLADTTMVVTTVPCWMCAGAILQHGIRRVVTGIASVGGARSPSQDLLQDHGVEVVDLGDLGAIEPLLAFMVAEPEHFAEDIGTAGAEVDVEAVLHEARAPGGEGG